MKSLHVLVDILIIIVFNDRMQLSMLIGDYRFPESSHTGLGMKWETLLVYLLTHSHIDARFSNDRNV